nr:hypothetical protein [Tanacetum cinerariifolium]
MTTSWTISTDFQNGGLNSQTGVLENAAKNDVELRYVLGDTISNPDQMRLKVEDRIRKKRRDFHKPKTGSVAFKVTFRDHGMSWDVWVPIILLIYSWQIHQWNTILSMMWIRALISFHDIGDVEFQDNWGRIWVDIGTSDYFALDVLLNCLTILSTDYLGIQQVVFGGRSMGEWEEGMKNPKDEYKKSKATEGVERHVV